MPIPLPRWVAARAPWLLAFIAALTLLALAQLVDIRSGTLRIGVDPSLEAVSTQAQADRDYAALVQRRFGNAEPVLVVVRVSDVFTTDNLALIDRLSRALAALDGVESVRSLTATTIPRVAGDTLYYSRLTPDALRDPELPSVLRESTHGNPLIEGQLVADDGRAAVILVNPAPHSELDMLRSDLAGRIQRTADAQAREGVSILVTGSPVIRSEISAAVTRQLRQVVPAIAIVVTVLLALAFPSVRGVLVPLLTIGVALTWVLGTLSFLGKPINLITALVPPFLVTMGLAYCAHVMAEYEALIRSDCPRDPKLLIAELLKHVSMPVTVTGFTTIAGLLALMLNAQPAMIEFAWISALGTGYLLVLVLSFVPAMLYYARPAKVLGPLPAGWAFEAGGEELSRFDQRHRRLILRLAMGAFALAMLLALRIEIGDVFVGVFKPEARVRADYEAANLAIGGVNPLDISIEASAPGVFADPRVLESLADLERWLAAQPEVGAVTGVVDHVQVLNRYLGGDPSGAIPASRAAISQLLLVGEGELLRSVVNADRSATLMRVRLTVDDTVRIGALLDRLRPRLAELPPGLAPRLTGSAVVTTESVRTATTGQLQSVALALGLVFLCLSAQFLSLRVGLLASLPTMLQTGLYFGVLGLLAVPMNPTTVLVECLVLGLAIDDTIHYLARFASAAKRSGSESVAAATALRAVLRPVTLTKAILALGFLTMLIGELRNQALFGWLAALTLFCAWLVDAFVTPAFMSGLRIVTLWDTLRLDLGDRVQQTIPLFAGLSNRQARVFALMANLHTLPAGTRLISEGDVAGSIYVIVGGEVSVNTGHGDGKVEIAKRRRGDVIGEHGYFGQRRTANVDTLTETRLLRFDEGDQERLCKAYPAIAARVFLALNRLQSQRQAERETPRGS
jgi:uncharacterized protein